MNLVSYLDSYRKSTKRLHQRLTSPNTPESYTRSHLPAHSKSSVRTIQLSAPTSNRIQNGHHLSVQRQSQPSIVTTKSNHNDHLAEFQEIFRPWTITTAVAGLTHIHARNRGAIALHTDHAIADDPHKGTHSLPSYGVVTRTS